MDEKKTKDQREYLSSNTAQYIALFLLFHPHSSRDRSFFLFFWVTFPSCSREAARYSCGVCLFFSFLLVSV